MLTEDASGGFERWVQKAECLAGKCSDCGIGNPNAIPTDGSALDCDSLWRVARGAWRGSASRIKSCQTARCTRSNRYRRADR